MILDKKYNRVDFINFLAGQFLPDFQLDIREVQTTDNAVFEELTHLGTSIKCGVAVFEVLCDESSSNRRVTATQNAFKVLRNHGIRNALVAFNYGEKWRFSLLITKLELQDGKVIRVESNPKRYSFILGVGTKINTPYKYLIEKGSVTNLLTLTERFSVEAVNKQFYESIATLFVELVGGERRGQSYDGQLSIRDVEKKSVKAQEFAVRLIGRVMFCWFLKEKKSRNGISLMPESLLSLDVVNKHPNYYHNVLEPIFFEVLNKHPRERYSEHKESPYNQIPYLNGGIFKQQKPDDYYNYCIATQSGSFGVLTIPNEWFVSLFELLNAYNFTVDENTVYDMDLSIDPEMLGRIFENLLAEINPETGESLKKSTGSYYTPREIVDYMVDSSLLYFLKRRTNLSEVMLEKIISYRMSDIDENPTSMSNIDRKKVVNALSDLTVLDPACGSGAFPIGMLQKVVYILQQVDGDARLWFEKQLSDIKSIELRQEIESRYRSRNFDYLRKLGVIRESIFGVDIQTVATEIARLRCYLSLIIEEDVDDDSENRGIRPLPNLDFKFISANSLIELGATTNQLHDQTSLFEDNLTDELKNIRDEYFTADSTNRGRLRNEYDSIQKQMFIRTIDNFNKQASERYTRLSRWSPFEYESSDWFDADWMFGIKDGFDIVIGNPPYGLINKKQNKHTSILISDSELTYLKSDSTYQPAKGGMLNIYRLFICSSYNLLKKYGNYSLIFPMAYMCDLSAANLRKHIFNNAKTLYIEAFPERDNEKKRVFEAVKMSVCVLGVEKVTPAETDAFSLRINSDRYVDTNNPATIITPRTLKQIDPKGMAIPIVNQYEIDVFDKVTYKCTRLGEVSKCFTGEIDLSLDKRYISMDSSNAVLVRGAQVQKYLLTNNISQGELLYLLSDEYLTDVSSRRSTHNEAKRILMQGITGVNEKTRLKMTIVNAGVFCANSVNYLLPADSFSSIEYLLGLLNSKLINWFFAKLSTNSNVNGYEVDNIPIRIGDNHNEITEIVKRILLLKSENHMADTSMLEMDVDKMVYKIYGLTNDDIKVVEGNF